MEKWTVHVRGGGVVTRRQLPLKLAWAMSIHKSQVRASSFLSYSDARFPPLLFFLLLLLLLLFFLLLLLFFLLLLFLLLLL